MTEKKEKSHEHWILYIQITVWVLLVVLPPIFYNLMPFSGNESFHFSQIWHTAVAVAPIAALWFVDIYLLLPLAYKGKKLYAVICAVLSYLALCLITKSLTSGIFTYLIIISVTFLVYKLIDVRRVRQQLDEEKRKNAEAELAWLKNQLNPHFLFNSLNNISTLTQVDPDLAQESIWQLSSLLRYIMYETNKRLVPLENEVEFMKNYIAIMRLRCDENTKVEIKFEPEHGIKVAPLLFISLIENAFKHGVCSDSPSWIKISLTADNGIITFICDNSSFPKVGKDHRGSGIGLSNIYRRLELIYPGKYDWEQTEKDGQYHVKLIIRTE